MDFPATFKFSGEAKKIVREREKDRDLGFWWWLEMASRSVGRGPRSGDRLIWEDHRGGGSHGGLGGDGEGKER